MKIKPSYIIIGILILAVIYLLDPCNCRRKIGNDIPKEPEVKPAVIQQIEVKKDEDSINAIIKPLEDELIQKDKKLTRLSNELLDGQDAILALQQESDSLRSLLKASELTTNINISAEKIREQIKKNDSICKKNIATLNQKLSIKDGILNAEKKKYNKLKLNFDSCTTGISELKKYAKDIKPRNKVAIGVTAGYVPESQSFAYGAILQLSMKNGYSIQGEALQIRGAQMYKVGVLKNISLRRK